MFLHSFLLFSSLLFGPSLAKFRYSEKEGPKVFVHYFDSTKPGGREQENVFNELSKSFQNTSKLTFKAVDCAQNQTGCDLLGRRASSTFVLQESDHAEVYYGARNVKSMRRFCLFKLGFSTPRSLPEFVADKPGELDYTCQQLNASTFNAKLKEKRFTFVNFYVRFCGFCKKFKPVWNDVTAKYKNNPNIDIVRVDCIEEEGNEPGFCMRQHVYGLPAIFLFKDGVFVEEYDGTTKMLEVEDFLESFQCDGSSSECEAKIEARKVREAARIVEHERKKASRAIRRASKTTSPY